MEKLDIVWRVAELLIAVVGASLLTRIITIRERVKQEKSNSARADAEAKAEQIENIRKTMEEVYRPIIEDLQKAIADARQDAEKACERVNELEDKVDALEKENRELRRENSALRDVLNEIRPDVVASKRSENLKQRAASMPRSATGQFVKKEE